MNKITKTFQFGRETVTLETGQIARQATSAVMVKMGDCAILVTVVGVKDAGSEPRDFFPLTVNYQERTYAGGKIPGGFLKREGRPSDRETLICRLIDRPVRPLFPEGFANEVQVVATVMSYDPNIEPDIPALIGASAALSLSGMPFMGPIGAARVGYSNGEYLLNPNMTEIEDSELNLVVAGTEKAVLMVESEAKGLSEEVMLGAVYFGHEQMQAAIKAINELKSEAGKPAWDWTAPEVDTALQEAVSSFSLADIQAAYKIADKQERYARIAQLQEAAVEKLCSDDEASPEPKLVKAIFHDIEKSVVRNNVLETGSRIDGRDTKTVRPITIEIDPLSRVHGSVLFTRGETQAIVTATLGTERDAQIIDNLTSDQRDMFMLHYNFPPYCVGEAGFMTGPKRREIGHGNLAKRAMAAVLPVVDDFPYTLRVVSEITESNGSSSMATVCGASLSLMAAGVPLKAPVAGIAMGLIKETTGYAVLTDILGDEDHLGDMDFKVAGTADGITALQMDIKTDGITREIMEVALAQANDARLHILGEMGKVLTTAREDVSTHAPRIITIKIDPDKIRDVIGKGGAVIRQLTEETGTTIDITDEGIVKVGAVDGVAGADCVQRIKDIVADAEVGTTYDGKVVKIMDFGAFVSFLNGKQGLVHISQICQERVEKVEDKLSEGQDVRVKVIEVDRQGRVRLSMKEVENQPSA